MKAILFGLGVAVIVGGVAYILADRYARKQSRNNPHHDDYHLW